MHFYFRNIYQKKRIMNGNGGVCKSRPVGNNGMKTLRFSTLYFINKSTFMIALHKPEFYRWKCILDDCFNIGKRSSAVNLRLPGSQLIQVGSVQNQYFHELILYMLGDSFRNLLHF